MKTQTQLKEKALALHLGIKLNEVVQDRRDENAFEADGCEYLVLTDSEADEKATEYIKDSVWAFNASFLADFTDLPQEVFTAMQGKCESSNDAILKCIERSEGGLKRFVEEAISADGRGHFMSSYDGEENEQSVDGETFYIYRTN